MIPSGARLADCLDDERAHGDQRAGLEPDRGGILDQFASDASSLGALRNSEPGQQSQQDRMPLDIPCLLRDAVRAGDLARGWGWRPGRALPSGSMSEPLRLTIVYEDAGDGDGWVIARIPQVRGAISQGATREQARENVIDALRELLAVRFGSPPELPDLTDSDSLELTIAA